MNKVSNLNRYSSRSFGCDIFGVYYRYSNYILSFRFLVNRSAGYYKDIASRRFTYIFVVTEIAIYETF